MALAESLSRVHVLVEESAPAASRLPWITTAPDAPYFLTEAGLPWTPIGHNEALTWPNLSGLFREGGRRAVERYLRRLKSSGVTCLRLRLEYCHDDGCYLENPVGVFQPEVVRVWDELFALCEQHGLRLLLTPFDTFWMWLGWDTHPYARANGGPCADRAGMLLCPATRAAIQQRLAFATQRWGGSGVIFAWDLWNELHPAYSRDSAEPWHELINGVGSFLRALEFELFGRAHLQTASVFGPLIPQDGVIREVIFRHPALSFASMHFYETGAIDHPQNTVDAALSVGRLTREALAEIADGRPFLDNEHGPIHTFKDHAHTLPADFDDESFRHRQWAHLTSGGAGGGLRWPNRRPHALTPGMHDAQRALAGFLPLIYWPSFKRRNLNTELKLSAPGVAGCACGDDAQALVWLVRTDAFDETGRVRRTGSRRLEVGVPGLQAGCYRVTAWDTLNGRALAEWRVRHSGDGPLTFSFSLAADLAFAVRRAPSNSCLPT